MHYGTTMHVKPCQ